MEAAKAVLIKASIALNIYVRKEEGFKMNHLSFYLKMLGKKSKLNPKYNERNN